MKPDPCAPSNNPIGSHLLSKWNSKLLACVAYKYRRLEFVHLRSVMTGIELISIESSPNVEYGKMRSEPDECALGADFRVIDSTFYFSWDASPIGYGG